MLAALAAVAVPLVADAPAPPPWVPPAPGSPQLLPFLRNTSRPKLAYSTWVGWYMGGGLNESSLYAQVEAMADQLRPHGWTHILHDCAPCAPTARPPLSPPTPTLTAHPRIASWPPPPADGWQVCGTTFAVQEGCIRVDANGRLYPSWERYPSTSVDGHHTGTWAPFVERVHAKGIAFGLHLMHGIPKLAHDLKLPILDVS